MLIFNRGPHLCIRFFVVFSLSRVKYETIKELFLQFYKHGLLSAVCIVEAHVRLPRLFVNEHVVEGRDVLVVAVLEHID